MNNVVRAKYSLFETLDPLGKYSLGVFWFQMASSLNFNFCELLCSLEWADSSIFWRGPEDGYKRHLTFESKEAEEWREVAGRPGEVWLFGSWAKFAVRGVPRAS